MGDALERCTEYLVQAVHPVPPRRTTLLPRDLCRL